MRFSLGIAFCVLNVSSMAMRTESMDDLANNNNNKNEDSRRNKSTQIPLRGLARNGNEEVPRGYEEDSKFRDYDGWNPRSSSDEETAAAGQDEDLDARDSARSSSDEEAALRWISDKPFSRDYQSSVEERPAAKEKEVAKEKETAKNKESAKKEKEPAKKKEVAKKETAKEKEAAKKEKEPAKKKEVAKKKKKKEGKNKTKKKSESVLLLSSLAKNGHTCKKDKDCLSGRCDVPLCRHKLGCRGNCKKDKDCAGGKCSSGICAECSNYKFCFMNNVEGAEGAGENSNFDVRFMTTKDSGKIQKLKKTRKDQFCAMLYAPDGNVTHVEIYFKSMAPLLINSASLTHNGRMVQNWGEESNKKGFCMAASKKSNAFRFKRYAECDKEIQFIVKKGKVYGNKSNYIGRHKSMGKKKFTKTKHKKGAMDPAEGIDKGIKIMMHHIKALVKAQRKKNKVKKP